MPRAKKGPVKSEVIAEPLSDSDIKPLSDNESDSEVIAEPLSDNESDNDVENENLRAEEPVPIVKKAPPAKKKPTKKKKTPVVDDSSESETEEPPKKETKRKTKQAKETKPKTKSKKETTKTTKKLAKPKKKEEIIYAGDTRINIFTDGSCNKNGKQGARAGYGIFIQFADETIDHADVLIANAVPIDEERQTNNVAELYAIKVATEYIVKFAKEHPEYKIDPSLYGQVKLYSDSYYAINALGEGGHNHALRDWKTDFPNKKLIHEIYYLVQESRIEHIHIEGHMKLDGILSVGNNIADNMAKLGVMRHYTDSPISLENIDH